MREIKFRGKRIEDSEWTYGHYVKGVHSYIISFDDFENAVVSIGGRMCTDSDVVYETTVGQYTGLKDENGVEIYEGDMIGHKNNVVEFSNGCFNTNGDRPLTMQLGLEVIGNIHDKEGE